jgi:hypothetical protein
VDRVSSGAKSVFDPALTIAIVTQPSLLRTLATKPDAGERGVLARPLYSVPLPVIADGPTPAADRAVLDEFSKRLRSLYEDVPALQLDEDHHPRPVELRLSRPAREAFEHWEREIDDERRRLTADDDAGLFLGWVSKLAGQTVRLAAALHVAEFWSEGVTTNAEINAETLERAVVLARYYREHALIAFGQMGQLPVQRRANKILGWLRSRTPEQFKTLTVRDVHQSRRSHSPDQVREALVLLEKHGWLRLERQEPGPQGGRPSERVHVHPLILAAVLETLETQRREGF